MTWRYDQSSGSLDHDGTPVGTGYSGMGVYRNDPTAEDRPNEGPIPRGTYTIGEPHDTQTHGPFVMRLTPDPSDDMHGRAGFLIHGDNQTHTASQGCIILARPIREQVWQSGDTELEVV